MNFWRLKQVLLTDLKRAVTSWGFMVGILGVAGMMLMAIGVWRHKMHLSGI